MNRIGSDHNSTRDHAFTFTLVCHLGQTHSTRDQQPRSQVNITPKPWLAFNRSSFILTVHTHIIL